MSVFVDDQEKALRFYTAVLGFVTKHDVPMGEYRWLTVVSPQDPDGTELLLEPSGHAAMKPFREPWWPTESRTRSSPSMTSTPSTSDSTVSAYASLRGPPPWGRYRPRC